MNTNYQEELLDYFSGSTTTSSPYDDATYHKIRIDWMREQLERMIKNSEEIKREESKQEAPIADDEWDVLMKNFRATQ